MRLGWRPSIIADELKHERRVALKVLEPELAAVVGAERFLAEIRETSEVDREATATSGLLVDAPHFWDSRGESPVRTVAEPQDRLATTTILQLRLRGRLFCV